MECIGPIIILLVAIAQIVTQVRKAQEAARRRAAQPDQGPARPPSWNPSAGRPAVPPPPWIQLEELDDDREVEAEAPPAAAMPRPRWDVPAEALAPRPPARPAPLSLPQAARRLHALRLDGAGLRNAIILMEVLGPPVALRDR